jgi:hypothetical protein
MNTKHKFHFIAIINVKSLNEILGLWGALKGRGTHSGGSRVADDGVFIYEKYAQ